MDPLREQDTGPLRGLKVARLVYSAGVGSDVIVRTVAVLCTYTPRLQSRAKTPDVITFGTT